MMKQELEELAADLKKVNKSHLIDFHAFSISTFGRQ